MKLWKRVYLEFHMLAAFSYFHKRFSTKSFEWNTGWYDPLMKSACIPPPSPHIHTSSFPHAHLIPTRVADGAVEPAVCKADLLLIFLTFDLPKPAPSHAIGKRLLQVAAMPLMKATLTKARSFNKGTCISLCDRGIRPPTQPGTFGWDLYQDISNLKKILPVQARPTVKQKQ